MAYASLAELKSALRITDVADDVLLQLALDSASELVDDHCGRTFVVNAVASTRTYDPTGDRIDVDDIYTTTDLAVSAGGEAIAAEVPGTSSGYRLGPRWAPQVGEPWTFIVNVGGSWATNDRWPRRWSGPVAVTARWGYAATVPAKVRQATLLQASRLFSRRHSPYGVAGSPELGGELRLLAKVDPDVAVMLSALVKMDAP